MTKKDFPIEKSDVHYDASSDEVSIKRSKFEALVKYTNELLLELEKTEDFRDVERFRTRKAEQTSHVLQALAEGVLEGTGAVREWLKKPGNTIRELSTRTGIPYATCHRIVNERLGTPNLEIGHLESVLGAIFNQREKIVAERPNIFRRILLGTARSNSNRNFGDWLRLSGSEVTTVHAGGEIHAKIGELRPDLVLVDISMPSLNKDVLHELEILVKETKETVILTGRLAETEAALTKGLGRLELEQPAPKLTATEG